MNPYEVLGVKTNATREQIKRAWSSKARKHHPDRGGDPKLMSEINQAYQILKDAAARERYDLTGDAEAALPLDIEARNAVLQICMAAISQEQDIDFYRWVVDNLTANMTQFRANTRQRQQHLERLKARRQKAKLKGQLLADLFDQAISQTQGHIEKGEWNTKVLEKALEVFQAACDPSDPMLDGQGRKMDPIAAFMKHNAASFSPFGQR